MLVLLTAVTVFVGSAFFLGWVFEPFRRIQISIYDEVHRKHARDRIGVIIGAIVAIGITWVFLNLR